MYQKQLTIMQWIKQIAAYLQWTLLTTNSSEPINLLYPSTDSRVFKEVLKEMFIEAQKLLYILHFLPRLFMFMHEFDSPNVLYVKDWVLSVFNLPCKNSIQDA